MLKRIVYAFLLVSAVLARAEELRVPVRDRDDFVLELPANWRSHTRFLEPILFPEVTILNRDSSLKILIVAIWPAPNGKAPTAESLRESTKQTIEALRSRAVESEIELHDIGAPDMPGCYFSATDRSPAPGGFKHITCGGVGLNELSITFTISTKERADDVTMKALDLIRSIRRVRLEEASRPPRK